uniref:Uncharacterized protein n=1 Tax=Poecilia latipinna TaxID=48699 RepID=A0A3B3VQ49_9TELE
EPEVWWQPRVTFCNVSLQDHSIHVVKHGGGSIRLSGCISSEETRRLAEMMGSLMELNIGKSCRKTC